MGDIPLPQRIASLNSTCIPCIQGTGQLEQVATDDWTDPTLPSWRHSNWVGVWDPWPVVFAGPLTWYRVVREIVTIERMHRAFARGLMRYGMMKAVKKQTDQPMQQAQTVDSQSSAGSPELAGSPEPAGTPISREQTVGLAA